MNNPSNILVADSGSTKTAWQLSGAEKIDFSTAGINPYYQDSDSISESLASDINFQKINNQKIEQVFFYGAGCSNLQNQAKVKFAIQKLLPDSEIHISHDMLGAARALCGQNAGIVCILGTGSNSCYFDGNEIQNDLPNLGFWLGDEGSAGYLGKNLVVKWFHNELPDVLMTAFTSMYNLDRDSFLNQIYNQPYPNRYLASFAPFLTQHIDNQWSRDFVADSFRLFFSRFVIPYPNFESLPVNFIGSVAIHFEPILRSVAEGLNCHINKIQNSVVNGLSDFHRPKL